jgi:SAM-dependent methyltransferase
MPAEYFAQGGSRLDERMLAVVGDVTGLTLCHLQCATGEDALSWTNKGAVVTGVDISPTQIELAKQKAAAAGLSTRFSAADIYDLPQTLLAEHFDIVFTGGGAIVWLPDLTGWAQTIAQLLKSGGRLILDEEHPLAECLELKDGKIEIVSDYFARSTPEVAAGWRHFAGGEDAVEHSYQFTWPLGDIITNLARAGLRIELLEERPSQAEWRFGDKLDAVARIPGDYLLIATIDK